MQTQDVWSYLLTDGLGSIRHLTGSNFDSGGPGFWGPIAGVGGQTAWGIASEPAARFGSYTLEARFEYQVASWWRKLPGMQSNLINRIVPRQWGFKTALGPWEALPGYSRTGWIDDIVPRGLNAKDGTHTLANNQLRYRVASEVKLKNGLRGAAGAALLAGLIDGISQVISDWQLCLSLAEKVFRASIAIALGIT